MALTLFRLFVLVCGGLTLSLSFCHLMEMPVLMTWDADLWVATTVSGNVFKLFGSVGALLEVSAVLSTILLAAITWRDGGSTRVSASLSAVLFALALGYWWVEVFPANREFASWVDGSVPADWVASRDQWEFGHAVRAILHLTGFTLLGWSLIAKSGSVLTRMNSSARTGNAQDARR